MDALWVSGYQSPFRQQCWQAQQPEPTLSSGKVLLLPSFLCRKSKSEKQQKRQLSILSGNFFRELVHI